ncbi:alpha/beta fold hydrolase [Candidatus Chlorohelix sp.]|uniref:alpha/beta fold hydrolase n=1 Tax=Candidatus Chlorohelix sp. TaxID=3139201 RepID=UPI003028350D
MRNLLNRKNKSYATLTLPGEERTFLWREHKVVYSILGEGAPLLMLHGINAAAWGYEYRRNYEEFAKHYRVYVPDLPGYGRSERKPIDYTAKLYIEFARDFASHILELEGIAPAIVVTSLSAAHVISAAVSDPQLFGPLVLISPTGLERLDFPPPAILKRAHRWLYGKLGSAVFSLLTTRLSTKIFLGRDSYLDKTGIDKELIEGYYATGHQPNAKYAPVCFITFYLNHSVRGEWEKISQPTLIVWGREAKITPLKDSELFLKLRPQTELAIIERARLSSNDERGEEFNQIVLEWLSQHYNGKKEAAIHTPTW